MSVRNDSGSALVLALVATLLLSALGQALVVTADVEQMAAANVHAGSELLYAADAGVERVLQDLGGLPSWSAVPLGTVSSGFVDTTRRPTLPSGDVVDLDALTSALQARSAATDPWGPNNPAWRLFAFGPLASLTGALDSRAYVVVWVADDPAETDGDPAVDVNRVLMLRVVAMNSTRLARTLDVTVGRDDRGRTNVFSWREEK